MSRCVGDIIRGEVDVRDVTCIVASTMATNKAEWDEVFDYYERGAWASNPGLGRLVAAYLIAAQKVFQPRVEYDAGMWHTIYSGHHWVEVPE
jgi:hypothetical protein